MYSLVVENISKKYGDTLIFENLNFKANKGSIVTILGKSGGGKSTFLRTICGLEKVNSGTITILGEKLVVDGKYVSSYKMNEILSKVGMVFQDYNLFANMNVKENICRPVLNKKNLSKKDVEDKCEKLLADFGVQSLVSKYPSQLSGGQSQRVAIVRALMLDPEIILFDEPTSALDLENSLAFVECVNRLHKQKYTVIIVTHDSKLVDNIESTEIYNMVDGTLKNNIS